MQKIMGTLLVDGDVDEGEEEDEDEGVVAVVVGKVVSPDLPEGAM